MERGQVACCGVEACQEQGEWREASHTRVGRCRGGLSILATWAGLTCWLSSRVSVGVQNKDLLPVLEPGAARCSGTPRILLPSRYVGCVLCLCRHLAPHVHSSFVVMRGEGRGGEGRGGHTDIGCVGAATQLAHLPLGRGEGCCSSQYWHGVSHVGAMVHTQPHAVTRQPPVPNTYYQTVMLSTTAIMSTRAGAMVCAAERNHGPNSSHLSLAACKHATRTLHDPCQKQTA